MTFHVSTKIWPVLTVLAVTVILLLAASKGVASGKAKAQAELVSRNAQAIAAGLEYFYEDFDRLPAPLEFQNQELMGRYFNLFPPKKFLSESCNDNYIYKKNPGNNYQLSFCLPKAVDGYLAGWNTIDGNN